jgi:hypothetical protein
MFNIKGFEWKELSGRTVRIQANETPDGTIVIARDIETNEIFVVQNDVIKED